MTTQQSAGRAPVRTEPWPAWPVADDTDAEAVRQVIEGGVWNGVDAPAVVEFERQYADFAGSAYAITCTNGSVSLELALQALGVGAGDEVIVPPYTFMATATAVLGVNALPVFADIEPDAYCLDPDAVAAAITPRTAAVIVVHLGGHPADVDRLTELCQARGIALIEDAAHAHGARWRHRPVGTFGAYGSWSFQGSKNLTAGEGGALTTDDATLAGRVRELRNCGRPEDGPWYEHVSLGGNWRLTAMQAALLTGGLRRLPAQLTRREEGAAYLDGTFALLDGISPLPRDPRVDVHAHHLYLFRYDADAFGGLSRAQFCAALGREGIPASPGYPVPLNRQPLFAEHRFDHRATGWDPDYGPTRYDRLALPVAERACAETVWLPHHLLLAPVGQLADVPTAIELVRDDVGGSTRR